VVREALRIAYAPAAYYRPWQAVYAGATVDQQRWLNTALLRQQRLPMPASLQAPDDPLARRLIGLWPLLPQVATLMGAGRLRDWVPAQRGCAALPATVQAFMRAGYGDDRPVMLPAMPAASLADTLLRWGGAELQPLGLVLPAWLSTRLCLPFLPMRAENECPPDSGHVDMDLFWNAVTYAEKLS